MENQIKPQKPIAQISHTQTSITKTSVKVCNSDFTLNDPRQFSLAIDNQNNEIAPLKLSDKLAKLADKKGLNYEVKSSHLTWILRFIRFNQMQHPEQMGQKEVESYLSFLAEEKNLEQDQQQYAVDALSFLYQEFLNVEFGNLQFTRLKPRRGFFSKFDSSICQAIINDLSGTTKLVARLAFEAKLRLGEVLFLRISDIDLKKNELIIRKQNGNVKSRINIPLSLILDLKIQSIKVHRLVQQEKEQHFENNYSELAILAKQLEPEWQFLFPLGNYIQSQESSKKLNQFPLSVVKNDLKLAYSRYRRLYTDQSRKVKNVYSKATHKNSSNNSTAHNSNSSNSISSNSKKYKMSSPNHIALIKSQLNRDNQTQYNLSLFDSSPVPPFQSDVA
ncbi:MAG: phage integrase N-terminal SAM-like domain-containing protein [Kangiellaceae bacterium]|nr:phage integrase N-terminal SAM-like domain-containing protein [Kangiellaceae bacterium]MCW8999718.1 phage integrase N-terminal SAM-like domain-containing protein [Kangiellaceae bacterium]MCW9016014.1 phage integrase N-terminal SAM-like domain-containing protein [Kangiellaceae bacterium]